MIPFSPLPRNATMEDDMPAGSGIPTRKKPSTNAGAAKEKTPEQKLSQVSCQHWIFNHLIIKLELPIYTYYI